MDSEGMVHALEEIQRLLKPGGTLIDIHPLPEMPYVEAYYQGKAIFSEPLLIDYLEGIRQAESALAEVVESGLFAAGKVEMIDFRHQASSPAELYAHWDAIEPYSDSPKGALVAASEEQVFSCLEACFRTTGNLSEFAIRERATISCYLPIKN